MTNESEPMGPEGAMREMTARTRPVRSDTDVQLGSVLGANQPDGSGHDTIEIETPPSFGELLDAVDEALSLDGSASADRRRAGSGDHLGIAIVVDDDRRVALVVSRILAACGLAVRAAHSHAEARELSRSSRGVSLFLVDHRMPDGPPWALIERIRREHPESKIIGSSGEDRSAAFLAHGVDGFLAKPWQLADLRRCLQSVSR